MRFENTLQNTSNSYDVYNQSYEHLLNKSDNVSIHQKHLRYLTIEVYKSLTKIISGFMWSFFEKKPYLYNLQRGDLLHLPPAKSTGYSVNSFGFGGSLLWNNLPSQLKESRTLEEFKYRIKNFRYIQCSFTVCEWCICICLFILIVTFSSFDYVFLWL